MCKTPGKLAMLSAFTFFAGGMIYFLFRSTDMIMFHALERLSPQAYSIVMDTRGACAYISLPDSVAYNLPDGLWLLSLLCLIHSLWMTQSIRVCRIVNAFMIVAALGTELLQHAGLVPGTADWLDAAAYAVAALIYLILTNQLFTICQSSKQHSDSLPLLQ